MSAAIRSDVTTSCPNPHRWRVIPKTTEELTIRSENYISTSLLLQLFNVIARASEEISLTVAADTECQSFYGLSDVTMLLHSSSLENQ